MRFKRVLMLVVLVGLVGFGAVVGYSFLAKRQVSSVREAVTQVDVCRSVRQALDEAGWQGNDRALRWLVAIDPRWKEQQKKLVLQAVREVSRCVGARERRLVMYTWQGGRWQKDDELTRSVLSGDGQEVTTAQLVEELLGMMQVPTQPAFLLFSSPDGKEAGEEVPATPYLGSVQGGWRESRFRAALPVESSAKATEYEVTVILPPSSGVAQGSLASAKGQEQSWWDRLGTPLVTSLRWVVLAVLMALLALLAYGVVHVGRYLRQIERAVVSVRDSLGEILQRPVPSGNAQGAVATSAEKVVDELRLERLRAIEEKKSWQEAVIRLFEAMESVMHLQGVSADVVQAYEQIFQVFSRLMMPLGLVVIRPEVGERFDDRFHVVESVVDSPALPEMSVVKCLRWGYSIQGEVVRKAAVVAVRPSGVSFSRSVR